MNRKFVVTGVRQCAFVDDADVTLQAGQALCRPLSVGLCGTDRLIFAGEMPTVQYPRVPCHEVVAEVLIDLSDRHLRMGTMVAVDPYKNCGTCHACRLGRFNCCQYNQTLGVQRDGVLREQFLIDSVRLHVVPTGCDPRVFVLAEPLALGLHILQRAGPVRGRWCLVAGVGNVGRLLVRLLHAEGAKVIAWDLSPDRLTAAHLLGADRLVEAGRLTAADEVLDATGNDGVAVAIESAGQSQTVEACIRLAAFAGRVVLVGHSKSIAAVKGSDIVFKELDVVGSRNSQRQFPTAIRMLAEQPDVWSATISHRFHFEEAPKAFALTQEDSSSFDKIVIEFPPWG